LPGSTTGKELEIGVRAVFERFVAAQNTHDTRDLRLLLLNAPDFLWITPYGETLWAALERFRNFFRGTWSVEPDMAQLRVWPVGISVAQLFVPVVLQVGAEGQPTRVTRLLLNQTLVRVGSSWQIASIVPSSAPTE
jgi:hypothetical protein